MEGGGGGKAMGYTHHHDTARLLKAFTRTVEPRNFGIGLVAGFLLITCAYFSTARFDAIHIAPLVSPSETRIGSPATAATAGSKSQFDLGVPGHDAALSMEGSKAKVLDTNPFTTPAPQMAPRHYMMM